MANRNRGYSNNSKSEASAPATRAFDITPTGVDSNGVPLGQDLKIPTRAIMVSEATTLQVLFEEELSNSAGAIHTTQTLQAGTLYPFCIRRVITVTTGNVKGYA